MEQLSFDWCGWEENPDTEVGLSVEIEAEVVTLMARLFVAILRKKGEEENGSVNDQEIEDTTRVGEDGFAANAS